MDPCGRRLVYLDWEWHASLSFLKLIPMQGLPNSRISEKYKAKLEAKILERSVLTSTHLKSASFFLCTHFSLPSHFHWGEKSKTHQITFCTKISVISAGWISGDNKIP